MPTLDPTISAYLTSSDPAITADKKQNLANDLDMGRVDVATAKGIILQKYPDKFQAQEQNSVSAEPQSAPLSSAAISGGINAMRNAFNPGNILKGISNINKAPAAISNNIQNTVRQAPAIVKKAAKAMPAPTSEDTHISSLVDQANKLGFTNVTKNIPPGQTPQQYIQYLQGELSKTQMTSNNPISQAQGVLNNPAVQTNIVNPIAKSMAGELSKQQAMSPVDQAMAGASYVPRHLVGAVSQAVGGIGNMLMGAGEAGFESAKNLAPSAVNLINNIGQGGMMHPDKSYPTIYDTNELNKSADIVRQGISQAAEGIGQSATAPFALGPDIVQKSMGEGYNGAVNSTIGVLAEQFMKGNNIDPASDNGKQIKREFIDAFNTGLLVKHATGGLDLIKATFDAPGKGKAFIDNHLGNTSEVLKARADTKLIQKTANDWDQLAKTNKPAFKNATDIYKRETSFGHDVGTTLAKDGLDRSSHITNGNFDTRDAAAQIRTDQARISNKLLRPALEQADQVFTPMPYDVVAKKALELAAKDTSKSKPEIIANIKSEFADNREGSLKAEHPNGFKLVDLHDTKIKFSEKVWDPLKPAKNTADLYISRASRVLLEENAPPGLNIGEFNAVLQKQYKAADYLDEIHGEKVPISIGQKMIHQGIAGAAGTAVGAATSFIPGGNLIAGATTYGITNSILNMLEDMPKRGRQTVLDNLKISDPEAFTAITEWQKAETGRQTTAMAEKIKAKKAAKQAADEQFINQKLLSAPTSIQLGGKMDTILTKESPSSGYTKDGNQPAKSLTRDGTMTDIKKPTAAEIKAKIKAKKIKITQS